MAKKKATTPSEKPLTKVEKFYIENNYKKSLAVLANDLERNVDDISAYYGEIVSKKMEENKLTAGKLMARNEKYGVTVMTKEASILGDEKNHARPAPAKKTTHIHRIRPE